ncbi:MAG: hypothetical protein KAG18_00070 [Sinobacterium sp.]|nr:hypothetical protein [Sinobacterium sp.]
MKALHITAYLLSFFMLFASAISVQASTKREYKTVEAVGTARSSDKALSKALNNAVSQVNGSTVSQKMKIEESEDEIRMGLFGNTVIIPSKEINTGFTQSYSKGVIKSYKVTDTQFDKASGDYKVTIEAEVEYIGDYESIGGDRSELIPLTVSLLRTDKKTYKGLNGAEPAAQVSERITTGLAEKLTQSNKFRMLDRRNLPKALSEDVISQSLGAKTGQQVKFQQKLSADLFVAGNIRQFDVAARKVKSYGSTFENYEGELVLDIRVVETATGEIRFAKRFEQYLTHDQIKSELDKYQVNIFSTQQSDKRRVQYAIESMMLDDVSNQIIQAFFPDYKSQSLQQFEDKKDEKTSVSDSPGSSEKPVQW